MFTTNTQDYYNAHWIKKSATTILEDFLRKARRRCFQRGLQSVARTPGENILFIGPGDEAEICEFSRLAEIANRNIFLLDISDSALLRLHSWLQSCQALSHAVCIKADAQDLPIEDGVMDTIYISMVLMHVNATRVLAETRRILRNGGCLVVVEPLAWHPIALLFRATLSDFRRSAPRYLSLREILTLTAPWAAISHREYYHLVPYVLPLHLLPLPGCVCIALVRMADKLDALIEKLFPCFGSCAWMTVVEFKK